VLLTDTSWTHSPVLTKYFWSPLPSSATRPIA
jgi:hypothetical protein